MLFNYHWLHAKISAVPIANVLEDFTRAIQIITDLNLKRQVSSVPGTVNFDLNLVIDTLISFNIFVFHKLLLLLSKILKVYCKLALTQTGACTIILFTAVIYRFS